MKEGKTARKKESEEGWIHMIQYLTERQLQMTNGSLQGIKKKKKKAEYANIVYV